MFNNCAHKNDKSAHKFNICAHKNDKSGHKFNICAHKTHTRILNTYLERDVSHINGGFAHDLSKWPVLIEIIDDSQGHAKDEKSHVSDGQIHDVSEDGKPFILFIRFVKKRGKRR